jgi:hypothetical protein
MQAYPFQHKDPTTGLTNISVGMTLRDYFAAKAMDVEMSCHPVTNENWREEVAKRCYEMADAMMEARK